MALWRHRGVGVWWAFWTYLARDNLPEKWVRPDRTQWHLVLAVSFRLHRSHTLLLITRPGSPEGWDNRKFATLTFIQGDKKVSAKWKRWAVMQNQAGQAPTPNKKPGVRLNSGGLGPDQNQLCPCTNQYRGMRSCFHPPSKEGSRSDEMRSARLYGTIGPFWSFQNNHNSQNTCF